jgi:aryl-alcohol dehydrogenase-like predicted oxidoreductase
MEQPLHCLCWHECRAEANVRYKLFGTSGLRVSELCLGAMVFGDQRSVGATKDDSRQIFEAFVAAGGNF